MSGITLLIVAVASFVASHELLSHALRKPVIGIVGEKLFPLVYSVVAFATLGWAVSVWRATPPTAPLWVAPAGLHIAGAIAMLFAAILFVGSVTAPNPALMGMKVGANGPQGVQRITRHPMMWAFAIWAMVHIVLPADARTVVLASGILVLALLGAAMQDRKKRGQVAGYSVHEAATGFIPFGAQAGGRAAWSTAAPGWVALIGGAGLFALLVWAHPMVIGLPALQWS